MNGARAWVAGPEEAETVAELLVAFRDHLGRDRPSGNAFLAGVERLVEDPATEFLLAAPRDGAPPAGVAQLRFRHSLWTAAPDCWLEDVYVAEPARRRGVARALTQLACDRARERGCRRIELDASEGNAAALALYEALGFTARSKGSGARDLLLGRAL
ncbi:MAG: GNAT family N-acetyltransferase [Actinomycetota bacterium]|nr:GNAT family N-acetyltransferase [Actinomycetota bacterium]